MSTRKGTIFESCILPLVNTYYPDSVRLGKQGVNDKGDIHMPGNRTYIIEAKNCKVVELAKWQAEADREAANKGVPFGVIVHKRRGFGKPEDQWATMRFGDFLAMMNK